MPTETLLKLPLLGKYEGASKKFFRANLMLTRIIRKIKKIVGKICIMALNSDSLSEEAGSSFLIQKELPASSLSRLKFFIQEFKSYQ
jgi:hypothetical protein